MKCYNHPLKDASAACNSCGRFICDKCEQIMDGKIFCPYCYRKCLANVSYQPVSGFIKSILYMISFFIMPLGMLIGVIFYTKPDLSYNRIGRNCIVMSVIPFILYCVCFLAYFFFAFGGALGSGLLDKAIHLPVY